MKLYNSFKVSLFLLSLGILFSCSKTDETRLRVDSSSRVTIPEGTPSGDYEFEVEVSHDARALLSEEGFAVEDIIESELKIMQWDMITPEDASFAFFSSAKMYLSAGDLPEILVAWKDHPLQLGASPLHLIRNTNDERLAQYLKESQHKYRVEIVIRRDVAEDIVFDINPTFFVTAQKD